MESMEKPLGPDYVQSTFMLKYLNAFTKATQLAKEVIMLFSHNGPLILIYKMDRGELTFCLTNINEGADQMRQ